MSAALPRRCAVVGAGAAGLAAARALQQQGFTATVFDKGRKPGGRIASRDTSHGQFDYGAPCFGADQPGMQAGLVALQGNGQLAAWPGPGDGRHTATMVGVPTMRALSHCWAQGLDMRSLQQVTSIRRCDSGWQLRLQDDDTPQRFDGIVVTVPYPQLPSLLPDTPLPALLAGVTYDPCWTLLWTPVAALPLQARWQLSNDSSIESITREDLKPGRSGPPRCVVHATAAWSAERLEYSAEHIAALLQTEAARIVGIEPEAHLAIAHRWRYARVRVCLGAPQLTLAPGLHYASDGCLGDGIESATLSGHAAAQALIKTGGWSAA